ncbi:3-dehydro-L-gulonate 2-dehydrogenase [Pedobacter sp. BS3]|uniref:3-dehydro-L-gulonate 2-dehydrogenase n=1 Tax=Pedobacter sp. BS3 TaxID=2567937 RepID=UPI0011ECCF21|nr:3-dehydro-L-gulonate 2-dehydrogenase [Pedobacter sp. BS3]TZF80902.1 3-dehydro-L-gulonate 2-dehydrogenase [Pedobacter sp. BS3]
MRISFHELKELFKQVLIKNGFTAIKADTCAQIFAENSRDGIYSHGLNRFPVFIDYVQQGLINVDAGPERENSFGNLEQWNGNGGPGVLNATACMNRAIELARTTGISCVALRNTNHWMRGGTYGLLAAEAGMIGICFTNTIAIIPPWGGTTPRLGNNPLIIAAPRTNGAHFLLDMAMSQYSLGKLQSYRLKDKQLPLPGGYDEEGNLSTNPAAIMASHRLLPIGFWKGSGLALMLDVLAAVLSNGQTTGDITNSNKETNVSQIYICINPALSNSADEIMNSILEYMYGTDILPGQAVSYPGQNMFATRLENMEKGIPVDETMLARVKALL